MAIGAEAGRGVRMAAMATVASSLPVRDDPQVLSADRDRGAPEHPRGGAGRPPVAPRRRGQRLGEVWSAGRGALTSIRRSCQRGVLGSSVSLERRPEAWGWGGLSDTLGKGGTQVNQEAGLWPSTSS